MQEQVWKLVIHLDYFFIGHGYLLYLVDLAVNHMSAAVSWALVQWANFPSSSQHFAKLISE